MREVPGSNRGRDTLGAMPKKGGRAIQSYSIAARIAAKENAAARTIQHCYRDKLQLGGSARALAASLSDVRDGVLSSVERRSTP